MIRLQVLKKHGPGLLAFAVGVVLVWMATPRTYSAYNALPAAFVSFQLTMDRPVREADLARALTGLKAASAAGVDQANIYGQLSQFMLLDVFRTPNDHQDEQLAAARDATVLALRHRPLDAYLWTRYTHLTYLLEGFSPYTIAALDKSFRYGTYERELLVFRLKLSLSEWESLPTSLREQAREQIRFSAQHAYVCGQILSYLDDQAAKRFISFLAETPADIELIQRASNALKRQRAS